MRRMFSITRTAFILLAFTVACEFSIADEPAAQDSGLRVLSWNVSSNAFVRQPDDFQALLRWADADIMMLDEVRPNADAGKLREVLADVQTGNETAWNIEWRTVAPVVMGSALSTDDATAGPLLLSGCWRSRLKQPRLMPKG